jgi:hypothetical protein
VLAYDALLARRDADVAGEITRIVNETPMPSPCADMLTWEHAVRKAFAAALLASLVVRGQQRAVSNDALVSTLDEIAIALNVWYRERSAEHGRRAAAHRARQEASWGAEPEPWVFAEEMIRRDDAELLEPIRVLMRKADAALSSPNDKP